MCPAPNFAPTWRSCSRQPSSTNPPNVARIYMKYLSFAFLCLSACAHAPTPAVFAFGAVQCVESRAVACVGEGPHCLAAANAVAIINAAVGRPIYRYIGSLPVGTVMESVTAGIHVVMDGETPAGAAGFTAFKENNHCIYRSITVVNGKLIETIHGPMGAIVLHELIHALGAGHADGAGESFGSVMAPALDSPHFTRGLSPLDAYTLHTVYGR